MPSLVLERWLTARGPERLALLAPLRESLLEPVAAPSEGKEAVENLKWLLRRVRNRRLPLQPSGFLQRDFAIHWNEQLGFVSPRTNDIGEPTYLEIETLLTLAEASGAVDICDGKSFLTPMGRRLVESADLLWEAAAATLPFVSSQPLQREIWELVLAWLLQPDLEVEPMCDAINEAMRADESQWRGRDPEEVFEVGITSLYTFAPGLSMFQLERIGQRKPVLTTSGEAMALAALRAASQVTFLGP